jgi:hypothetical protein
MKVLMHAACGKAPKMALIRDPNLAFAQGDLEFLKSIVTDDIQWVAAGDFEVPGTGAFVATIEKFCPAPSLPSGLINLSVLRLGN